MENTHKLLKNTRDKSVASVTNTRYVFELAADLRSSGPSPSHRSTYYWSSAYFKNKHKSSLASPPHKHDMEK